MNEYTYIITDNPNYVTTNEPCYNVCSNTVVNNPYDIRQNLNITQDLMYISDGINSDCQTLSDIIEKVFNTITNKEIKEEKKMKKCTCTKNWFNEVTRVIFNLSNYEGEDAKPTLTTVVYFSDGSRSVVQNTEVDGVKLNHHDDGTVTATDDSKELGVIYAVTKRFLGKLNEDTHAMEANGYMNKLRKIIRKGSDANQQKARRQREKKEARARHEKMIEDAKARREANPSFGDCVKLFKKTLEDLKQKFS